jgi:hypothetical protein
MDGRTPEDDDNAKPIQDDLMMQKMKEELIIIQDGHIQLPTLWKEGRPETQNNYEYAKKRLFALLGSKGMTSSPTLLDDYGQVIAFGRQQSCLP